MSIEKELDNILKDYVNEVDELTNDTMKKASRNAVKELKTTSAKRSGDYAKDWAVKTENGFGKSKIYIVHNRKHYMLTHLLENGHIARNQYGTYGRVNGDGHIKDAEQNGINEVISTLEAKL